MTTERHRDDVITLRRPLDSIRDETSVMIVTCHVTRHCDIIMIASLIRPALRGTGITRSQSAITCHGGRRHHMFTRLPTVHPYLPPGRLAALPWQRALVDDATMTGCRMTSVSVFRCPSLSTVLITLHEKTLKVHGSVGKHNVLWGRKFACPVEQGLTFHSTHQGIGHLGDNIFTGSMTQPTVSRH